ncbi:MAG: hypothetical protein ACTHJS_18565, partial [Xanthobacteraceae bacterium]
MSPIDVLGFEGLLHPLVPPQLRARRVGAAALAAAFLVFTFGAGPPADAGEAAHQAGGLTRLEAEYVASIAGIPIGRGNWIIELSDDAYSAAASGTTTGIIRFFTGGRGSGSAHGTISAGQPMPTT